MIACLTTWSGGIIELPVDQRFVSVGVKREVLYESLHNVQILLVQIVAWDEDHCEVDQTERNAWSNFGGEAPAYRDRQQSYDVQVACKRFKTDR